MTQVSPNLIDQSLVLLRKPSNDKHPEVYIDGNKQLFTCKGLIVLLKKVNEILNHHNDKPVSTIADTETLVNFSVFLDNSETQLSNELYPLYQISETSNPSNVAVESHLLEVKEHSMQHESTMVHVPGLQEEGGDIASVVELENNSLADQSFVLLRKRSHDQHPDVYADTHGQLFTHKGHFALLKKVELSEVHDIKPVSTIAHMKTQVNFSIFMNDSKTQVSQIYPLYQISGNPNPNTVFNIEENKLVEHVNSSSLQMPSQATDTDLKKRKPNKLCKICGYFGPARKSHVCRKYNYKCEICNRCFHKEMHLLEHTKLAKCSAKPLRCELCPKRFFSDKYLKLHIKLFHEDPSQAFSCDICHKIFSNSQSLILHKQYIHSVIETVNKVEVVKMNIHGEHKYKYLCGNCNKAFGCSKDSMQTQTYERFMKHENVCLKMPFACKTCHRSFSNRRYLHNHMRHHTRCTVCGLQCMTPTGLQKHVSLHGIKKVYQCGFCSEQFEQESDLDNHMKEHDKALHHCEICKLDLLNNCLLEDHLKVHHDLQVLLTNNDPLPNVLVLDSISTSGQNVDAPCSSNDVDQLRSQTDIECSVVDANEAVSSVDTNSCRKCKQHFENELQCASHMAECEGKKEFRCGECNLSFHYLTTFCNHMTVHVSGSFTCEECGNIYKNKNSLRGHKKNAHGNVNIIFTCEHCGKICKNKNCLYSHKKKVHMKKDGNETTSCEKCGTICNSKGHLRNHQRIFHGKDEPVACEVCGNTYKNQRRLQSHRVRVHRCEPIACDECGKIYKSRYSLSDHKRTVHRKDDK